MTPPEDDPFATPAADATDTSMIEHNDKLLAGSDTLPATFQIDGETVALGTIVAAAFEKSGLTEDEWNALPAEERDAKLHAELDARGADGPEGQPNASGALADAKVIGASTNAPTHDTEHDKGLSDQDARVPGDAVPVAGSTVTVDAPKEPLGSLADTATTSETVSTPLTINTDVSDKVDDAPTLGDAVVPTKPGGADLEDIENDATKDVLSRAPKRAHEGLVNQLDLKIAELKHFVSMLEGEIDGELGEFLDFIRARL